ncbi:MAG TPA: hypothetical protein VI055_08470 [Rubrobacter sp.]|jgi:hypothetical protein
MPSKKAIEEAGDNLREGDIFYHAEEFNLSWMPTLGAMWSPEGQQVMIQTPVQPTRRYGIGAVDYHSGQTVVLIRPRVAERIGFALWWHWMASRRWKLPSIHGACDEAEAGSVVVPSLIPKKVEK